MRMTALRTRQHNVTADVRAESPWSVTDGESGDEAAELSVCTGTLNRSASVWSLPPNYKYISPRPEAAAPEFTPADQSQCSEAQALSACPPARKQEPIAPIEVKNTSAVCPRTSAVCPRSPTGHTAPLKRRTWLLAQQ